MVVTTNGCFDILHVGHLKLLETAKSLGYLIVLINSDYSVKQLKGKDRPINNELDRKKMLLALRCVDEVRVFADGELNDMLDEIKPSYHVKSINGYKGLEREVVEKNGGRVLLIEDTKHSTTKIINEKEIN